MTTSRNRAMTLLIVAFIVGALVGGGVLGMAVRGGKADWVWQGAHQPTDRQATTQPQRPAYGVYLDSVLGLKLTPAAKDSVTAIYRRGVARMDSINRASSANNQEMWLKVDSVLQPYRAPVEAIRIQTRAAMRGLLRADQQTRFDSLMKANDEMRQRRRQQGPGAGRGDGRSDGGNRGGAGSSPSGAGHGGPGGPGQPAGGGLDRGPI